MALSCCASLMPVSADVSIDNVENDEMWGTYYKVPIDFDIQSVIDDDNKTLVMNGKKFTLTLRSSYGPDEDHAILYLYEFVDEDNQVWVMEVKPTTNEVLGFTLGYMNYGVDSSNVQYVYYNTTVGDSTTIGESETTIRGDVNLDGKVNSLDLLVLKKYLLGLIEW